MTRFRVVIELEVEASDLSQAVFTAQNPLQTAAAQEANNGGYVSYGSPVQRIRGYEIIEAKRQ